MQQHTQARSPAGQAARPSQAANAVTIAVRVLPEVAVHDRGDQP
jgi:hypothetical protein